MMNGLRKFEVKYSGDPELQPIRSFENPTLVRLLYKLSTQANQKVIKILSLLQKISLPPPQKVKWKFQGSRVGMKSMEGNWNFYSVVNKGLLP